MFQWSVSLDPQVSLALRALLARLVSQVRVLKVCPVLRDLLDPQELPDDPSLANLEPQVDLASPVLMEPLVRKETLEPLALRDPEEPREPQEPLDLLDSLRLANLDLLDSPELWDHVESLVLKDILVSLGCQVPKETWGLEPQDHRVRQDHRDPQVLPEPQVREELESQESPVCPVSQEREVFPEEMAPLVQWDQWDLRATLVPQV